jgi:hypothetical protein
VAPAKLLKVKVLDASDMNAGGESMVGVTYSN